MATDKLANMREPVLSLDLDINEKSGMKQVSVELSKDELKELITSLEAANKVSVILYSNLLRHAVQYESSFNSTSVLPFIGITANIATNI